MSDGPHYSLNMRKHWKNVGEKADTAACSTAEIANEISDALVADFKKENGHKDIEIIKSHLLDEQGNLFVTDAADRLEYARMDIAGHDLIERCIDHSKVLALKGVPTHEILEQGLANALAERVCRNNRSMVEHWQREDTSAQTKFVEGRLNQASQSIHFQAIANEIISSPPQKWEQKSRKQTNIDAGPSL